MRSLLGHLGKYLCSSLLSLAGLLLIAAVAVVARPDHVYYHDKGHLWQTICFTMLAMISLLSAVVRFAPLACGLLTGGGLANVLGRMLWHGSPDYLILHLPLHKFFFFNLADVAIIVGVFVITWTAGRSLISSQW